LERPTLIKPGPFAVVAAADSRRGVFDMHNDALLAHGAPVDAVFIGDSITDMWALDVYFRGASGGYVVNRGIGGDRTTFVRRRFAADVAQLRPQLAVIEIGVNNTWDLDVWWDPALIRTPGDIENEIVVDIEAMVQAARGAGAAVALCSILPTDIPFNGNNAARNRLIARSNDRLKELAAREGATYVDYHCHLAAEDGLTLRSGLADDGLHPHTAGYEIMTGALLDTLRQAGVAAIEHR
jgi:lysophospholipase L1-like esterase